MNVFVRANEKNYILNYTEKTILNSQKNDKKVYLIQQKFNKKHPNKPMDMQTKIHGKSVIPYSKSWFYYLMEGKS